MNRIYIFDVDGTLTPSRLPMTEEFLEFFDSWSKRNPFYLVTGSDINKTKQQVPDIILDRVQALFTCCGSEMWKPDPHIVNISAEQIYRREFKPPKSLLKYLEHQLRLSDYHVRAGNHIEDRGTLLNFSMVGRDCTLQQRKDYHEYDKLTGERETIATHIRENWEDLDAVIGGEISIDIYPKGNDKSQILEHIIEREPDANEFIFFGDGIENGNDYPLAELLSHKDRPYGYAYQVDGWEHTKRMLEKL